MLRTGFTSGEPPDIFQHEGHNNLFHLDLGEVEPIDDFWAENGDRFLPGTDASIKKGDTYFGVLGRSTPTRRSTTTTRFSRRMGLMAHLWPPGMTTWPRSKR